MEKTLEKLNGMSINLNNNFLTKEEFIYSAKMLLYKIMLLGFIFGFITGAILLRLLQW